MPPTDRHPPKRNSAHYARLRGFGKQVTKRKGGTGQSGAVERKDDGEILQGHLLKDLIVRSLQKRTVDIHHGANPGLGQSGCKRDRVRFADTSVKESLREFLPNRL